jgi:Cft2 family RNA processing exonuclease
VILKFLGAHDEESTSTRLVSFIIDEVLAVDAGSLTSELTFIEQKKIEAILLSHGHYDHVRAIPAFAFNNSHKCTKIFSTQQTLQILSSHLIDGIIYPNFTSKTSFVGRKTLQLIPVKPYEKQLIQGYEVMAIPVKHPLDAVGFEIISPDGTSIFYTGDTGPGLTYIWRHISPQLIISDVTFPNRLKKMANSAGHLCPEMLEAELTEFIRVKQFTPDVIALHLNPRFETEITDEINSVANSLGVQIRIIGEGEQYNL